MIKYSVVLFHYCLILILSAKMSYWIMGIHEYPVFGYAFIFYFVYSIVFFFLCVVLAAFWTLVTVVGYELSMYLGMKLVAYVIKKEMKLDKVDVITSMTRVNLKEIQFKLFYEKSSLIFVYDIDSGFEIDEEVQQLFYQNRVKQNRLKLFNNCVRLILNGNRIFSEYNKLFNVH